MADRLRTLTPTAHDYFCHIWLLVKQGKLDSLEGGNRIVGRVMLEHPEFQHLRAKPYSFAEMDLERLILLEGRRRRQL